MANRNDFGPHIRAGRALKRMSQADLAKVFGVDKSLISHWESGARVIGHAHFVTLCRLFGWTGKQKDAMERLKLDAEASA